MDKTATRPAWDNARIAEQIQSIYGFYPQFERQPFTLAGVVQSVLGHFEGAEIAVALDMLQQEYAARREASGHKRDRHFLDTMNTKYKHRRSGLDKRPIEEIIENLDVASIPKMEPFYDYICRIEQEQGKQLLLANDVSYMARKLARFASSRDEGDAVQHLLMRLIDDGRWLPADVSRSEEMLLQEGLTDVIRHVLSYNASHPDAPIPFGTQTHPLNNILTKALRLGEWDLAREVMRQHPELVVYASRNYPLHSVTLLEDINVKDMTESIAEHFVKPIIMLEKGWAPGNTQRFTPEMMRSFTRASNHIAARMLVGPDAANIEAMVKRIEGDDFSHRLSREGLTRGDRPAPQLTEDEIELIIRVNQRAHALSNTWHHPSVTLKHHHLPDLPRLVWHPLFEGEYVDAETGFRIKALTTTEQLKEESAALAHCVGESNDYAKQCCEENTHILSVMTPDGTKLSTVELSMTNEEPPEFEIVQHMGYANTEMEFEDDQRAHDSLQRLLEVLRIGEKAKPVRLFQYHGDFDCYGKDEERSPPADQHPLISSIGFNPSWEHLQLLFDEYKSERRRGSLEMDAMPDGRIPLAYLEQQPHASADWTPLFEGGTRAATWAKRVKKGEREDFIKGDAARNAHVRKWLYDSGTMDIIHAEIIDHLKYSGTGKLRDPESLAAEADALKQYWEDRKAALYSGVPNAEVGITDDAIAAFQTPQPPTEQTPAGLGAYRRTGAGLYAHRHHPGSSHREAQSAYMA